jgi:hypothetical protein
MRQPPIKISVVDPDPHGSGFAWIRIHSAVLDPDPDPGAWKLTNVKIQPFLTLKSDQDPDSHGSASV